MTDTPPSEDDDLLASATVAPEARQHHRSHRSHRRRKGLKPIDIAGIVVAVLVVIGVVIVIAKGHKSTSSATATTVTTAAASGASSTTAAAGGGPNATTWIYTSLDGKRVTIVKGPSGSVRFAVYQGNSIPLTAIAVDKALAKNDCNTVESIYNGDKAAQPSGSVNSNARRSAFAHYALVQATAHGCAWAKAIPAS